MCAYAQFEFMKLFRRYEFTKLKIIRSISDPSKWLSAAIYQQENERLSLIDASTRAILNYETKLFDNFESRRCTLTIYL